MICRVFSVFSKRMFGESFRFVFSNLVVGRFGIHSGLPPAVIAPICPNDYGLMVDKHKGTL